MAPVSCNTAMMLALMLSGSDILKCRSENLERSGFRISQWTSKPGNTFDSELSQPLLQLSSFSSLRFQSFNVQRSTLVTSSSGARMVHHPADSGLLTNLPSRESAYLLTLLDSSPSHSPLLLSLCTGLCSFPCSYCLPRYPRRLP